VRFPDVEALILGFLAPVAAPYPVHVSVPATRPKTFVRAWRNGGAAANRVLDNPTITVEAWAPSTTAASELAEDCRTALLHELATLPLVRGVSEVTGPYSIPDPESKSPRYRFSIRVRVRAAR
jgi:hypothetical protein